MTPLLLALARIQEGAPAGSEGPPPQGLFGGSMFFPLILIGVIFWFVVIGPERKQRKKREAMLGAIKKGDKVMTTSGLYGAVVQVTDEVVTLQVADGVRLRFSRGAVQTVLDEAGGEKTDKGSDTKE